MFILTRLFLVFALILLVSALQRFLVFAATDKLETATATTAVHFLMSEKKRSMASSSEKKTRKKAKLWPPKYYKGLTRRKALQRQKEIAKFGAMPTDSAKAYVGFQTDKDIKTKPSSYTRTWNQMFPEAKSLEERSRVTGVPVGLLRESFNRGMAAWRTGHRPGATQQQWGYARVSSLLLCGKTAKTTDADLVRKAKETAGGKAWYSKQGC